jgi:hypothetical protein
MMRVTCSALDARDFCEVVVPRLPALFSALLEDPQLLLVVSLLVGGTAAVAATAAGGAGAAGQPGMWGCSGAAPSLVCVCACLGSAVVSCVCT